MSIISKFSITRKTFKKFILLILAMFGLVITALMMYSPTWYAITLDTNQTYFGNLSINPFSQFVTLDNTYYVRSAKDADGNPLTASTSKADYLVVRIENDVHGPRKKMKIQKSHILLYQELRADSPVMGAIIQDKRRGR